MPEQETRVIHNKINPVVLKIVITSIFTAIGVVFSLMNPFGYMPIYGIKPNPFVHLMNVLSGVLLGPLYSIIVALLIAILRNILSIGTIMAFPGGLGGAISVSLVAYFLKKKFPKKVKIAAFAETFGTLLIGLPISLLLVTTAVPYITFVIFLVASLIGVIIGYFTLSILEKRNITFMNFQKFASD